MATHKDTDNDSDNEFTDADILQIIDYNGDFWEYYGIRIPTYIRTIPSIDRVNELTFDHNGQICETLMYSVEMPYTLKEYQSIYAIIGTDGKLYWNEDVDENASQ